ncbi:helix-turn-helix domain-containing protein [Paenibacillus thailandensis]|uniref:Helix-turn-helix domain-containing protein n=1 Tax=Paenibacillus thailandensis TaxID=393250 RepID=A0ABW5QTY2_9BACL
MTMGERLKMLRVSRNLSQDAVARTIGITRSAYSHYEINNRQPVYDTLIKLAAFFNVSIDFIIEGEDRKAGEDLTPDTKEIVQLLNNMDEEQRKQSIDKMLQALRAPESS